MQNIKKKVGNQIMKEVKLNKQMQSVYKHYLRSINGSDLYDCYHKPSYNKMLAMEYCEDLCNKYDGTDLTIIGYNSMQFSVGFLFYKDGKNYFAYITKTYDRFCCID